MLSIREKLETGLVKTMYLSTKDQLTDVFIKAIHPSKFQFLFSNMSFLICTAHLEGILVYIDVCMQLHSTIR